MWSQKILSSCMCYITTNINTRNFSVYYEQYYNDWCKLSNKKRVLLLSIKYDKIIPIARSLVDYCTLNHYDIYLNQCEWKKRAI